MGGDDTRDDDENSGLEILDEPVGVTSVVTPIAKSDSPDAFVSVVEDDADAPSPGDEESEPDEPDVEDDDDIEELDVEELDEFELVEEDDESDSARPQRSSAAPPPMPAPPPTPPRGEAAPAKTASEPAATPPPPPTAAAEPLEFKLVAPAEISALDALLEGREKLDWKRRAEKLTNELEMAKSKARVGELAYELGELYQRHLGDEASAVKAYGRALQSDPSLRANLWAIRRIFYRRKLWPNLVKLIGAELRFASNDAQRADLHLERGRILLDGVGEPEGAREAFEQALALDEGNHTALLALETLASQRGDSELLYQTLEQLARVSSRPERRVAILVELARELRQNGGDLERARAVLAEAAALDCLHEAVDREREALARHSDDSGALAAVLEARIGRLQESFGAAGVPEENATPSESGSGQRLREILALRREQAQVLAEGGDEDGAWSCLHQALSLTPHEPLLLADLTDLADKLGRYEELAELVAARESGEVDASRAIGLALRRASALSKAGKQDQADEVLASRARSNPGYLPLIVAREVGAGGQQDWSKLAALQAELAETLRLGTSFGEGADTEPEPSRAAVHYVVSGDLLRFGTEDLLEAAARYSQALEVDSGCLAAVDALVDLHVAAGRHDEAAQLLEAQLKNAVSDDGASSKSGLADSLRSQLAALYLLSGQTKEELLAVDGLLASSPTDIGLMGRRVDLLREVGDTETLCEALLAQAEVLSDPDAQALRYFEAGRLLVGPLQRAGDAAGAFRKCRERWPGDTIVNLLELAALRTSQNWDSLVECLRAHLGQCADEEVATLGREALAVLEFQQNNSEEAVKLALQLCERVPGDRALLHDALACCERAASAEPAQIAEVVERVVALAEGEAKTRALLRLGGVYDALGRTADAKQAFRDAGEEGSTAALVALHQSAVTHGERELQAEALGALASTLAAPEHRASVFELSAWDATVQGSADEGLRHFESARETGDVPVGPLLGLSLLSAKSQDRQAQGEYLEALADSAQGAYAQSSLLLHSAMLAEVQGDEDLAGIRLRKARQISPQDAGTAVVLADRLSPLNPEGSESVSDLLERGELCDMRSVLAEAGSARVDWELERAEALELAGHLQESIQAVASVLDLRPGHIRGLQTLRRVCIRGGDRANQAKACVALARQIGDPEGRVALFREAVEIFDGELDNTSSAVAAYQAILAELPGAPEYDRYVALLAEHTDTKNLYRAHSARLKHLSVVGESKPKVPILFSRARLRKDIGDFRGASRDLAALLELEPSNPDALFERAQLLERLHEDRDAAEHLKKFLDVEVDPTRRATAELSLSHLMADSLDDLQGAIEQLEQVVRQSPHDLEVRERLLSLLVKGKRIEDAASLIREMAGMRASDGERARDELRVAKLWREASKPDEAVKSLQRARQYDPLNIDALSGMVELRGGDEKTRASLIADGVHDLRRAIADQSGEPSLYEKLAIVAHWGDDKALERQALHALEMAGSLSAEQEKTMGELGEAAHSTDKPLSAETWRSSVLHRDAGGLVGQLWGVIGSAVTVLSEGTPEGLGFERGDRVKGRSVAKTLPEIAKIATYLGIEGLEVYYSEDRASVARAITDDTPTVCLGGSLASAETAEQLFSLGRCLAHVKAGTGSASTLAEADLFLYFAAAAELAGVSPLPPVLAERVSSESVSGMARRMSKALGRRSRKELTLLASRFSELDSPVHWRQGVEQSAARVGLLLCGSLRAALDVLDVGKGGRPLADSPIGRELMAWSVGGEFLGMEGVGERSDSTDGGSGV